MRGLASLVRRTRLLVAALSLAGAVGLPVQALASRVRVLAGELDTAATPAVSEAALRAQGGRERALAIVALDGPARPGWRARATRAGVKVEGYLPDHSYLVTLPPAALPALRALPRVAWVGELPAALKIEPRLRARVRSRPDQTRRIAVLSFEVTAAKQLELWGYEVASTRLTPMGWWDTRLVLRATETELERVASLWNVFHLEEEPAYQLFGARAAQTAAGSYLPGATDPTGPDYAAFLASHELGGTGLVVQLQDDGVDTGDASNLPGTAHPDLLGRIAGIFNATSDPKGDGVSGHAEINAGILVGNATVGTADAEGYLLGQGVAPEARVYVTKIFRNSGQFDLGGHSLTDLAQRAQDAGAIVSNNSWGAPVNGAYTAESAEFDALTRDADPAEAGHQPMLYLVAAGNDGPGSGTLGAPASAKNVIAVGAAENSDADGTDGCGVQPSGADDLRDLIFFSSRGPAADGRQGVTLVSVGTHNQGPASISPSYDGSGVCDMYWPSGQTDYARSSGTSHSTPTAAGVALLVYELFQKQLSPLGHTSAPSPALLRSALTATATDQAGAADGNGGSLTPVPNRDQGWGSVNLSSLVDMKEHLFTLDQSRVFDGAGESYEVTVRPVVPGEPLKVVLAWTDAPALPLASPTLVNDLDLVVTDGASTYRGNVFSGGFSIPGGSADSLETLEAVFVQSPTGGPVVVRVEATNVPGDGVPGVGDATDQDFALFVWNGLAQESAGVVGLGADPAACGQPIDVFVSDLDLRGAGTQSVALSAGPGDAETLLLTETAPASGLFRGALDSVAGAPHPGDGQLQVAEGASVVATYDDADDGSGSPATVTDSATADCSAPSISAVQASAASTSATISFDTSEPAAGRVDFGPSCTLLTQSRPGSAGLTSHAITLPDLSSDSDYFYAVSASDVAGNVATEDNGGSCFSFSTATQATAFLAELFTGDNDLANSSLLLRPDGAGGYELCIRPATAFPIDPSGATLLALGDDDSVEILPTGQTIPFFGSDYASFFVNSNGNLTFGVPSGDYLETFATHFAVPRISALFDDLDPTAGGSISVRQLPDRMVVTWEDVPQYGTADANSFQVELLFSGEIRITLLALGATDGIVGLSAGGGTPPGFVEADLSATSSCSALDANLGFELADFTNWETTDLATPFFPLLVGGPGITPGLGLFTSAPTEGSLAALHGFDGLAPGTIRIERDLGVPAVSSPQLGFDYRAGWDLQTYGATLDRSFRVVIEPAGGGPPLQTDVVLVAQAGTVQLDTGSLVGSVDLGAFAGQTVRVAFEWIVPEGGVGPAFFQLDDVRVDAPADMVTIAGTISVGGTGVPGVVLSGLPGNPSTDESGFYTVTAEAPFTGTATPAKFGYRFEPPSRSYAALGEDRLAEDYAATAELSEVRFDFDTGLGEWEIDNASGAGAGLWHLTTACEAAAPGHSAPSSLYYGIDASCSYDAGPFPTEGTLTSPPIFVADGELQLHFRYSLETERQAGYDVASVWVSIDGGAYRLVAGNDVGAQLVSLSDPTSTWTDAMIDLTPLLTPGSHHLLRLRFGFATGDAYANGFTGFAVDDVSILYTGSLPPPPVPLPPAVSPVLVLLLGAAGIRFARRTPARTRS